MSIKKIMTKIASKWRELKIQN